jgi:putative sigma-54 modulation protein
MRMAITSSDFRLRQDTFDLIERRMRFALTRFAAAIDDVSVMISDANGPKKGPLDKKCRVVIRLHPKGSIVINQLAGDIASSVSIAAERVGRVVGRHLERRRNTRRSRSRRHVDPRYQDEFDSPLSQIDDESLDSYLIDADLDSVYVSAD